MIDSQRDDATIRNLNAAVVVGGARCNQFGHLEIVYYKCSKKWRKINLEVNYLIKIHLYRENIN